MDIEVVTLSFGKKSESEVMERKIEKTFKIYRGFDIRTLDFNKDYIAMTGC